MSKISTFSTNTYKFNFFKTKNILLHFWFISLFELRCSYGLIKYMIEHFYFKCNKKTHALNMHLLMIMCVIPMIQTTTVTVIVTRTILVLKFCNHALCWAFFAAALNSFPTILSRSLTSCRSSSFSPRSITFWTFSRITSVTSWICSLTLEPK